MRRWVPSQIWNGQDAYIIGGGPSLARFDWELLRDKNTIGCNSAFILGAGICKICVFGDLDWWQKIGHDQLQEYGGPVVGCCAALSDCPTPEWLLYIEREDRFGLSNDKLCWNGHTGSLAINLALRLGARRVCLLGFDMSMPEGGNPNWHDVRYDRGDPTCYPRYVKGFKYIVRDLPVRFPGTEILNVTDNSKLDCFPKISMQEHFGENWRKP